MHFQESKIIQQIQLLAFESLRFIGYHIYIYIYINIHIIYIYTYLYIYTIWIYKEDDDQLWDGNCDILTLGWPVKWIKVLKFYGNHRFVLLRIAPVEFYQPHGFVAGSRWWASCWKLKAFFLRNNRNVSDWAPPRVAAEPRLEASKGV